MRIGSLCSGYGGLEMGALAVLDASVAWHVENDPNASRILAHHWPDVPNHGDLTTVDWAQVEPVGVLTAGYPCQPFSHAGKRKGAKDERHLWPYVVGAVRHLRPRLVLLENVAGHLSLGFDVVLGDLAAAGFDAEWVVLRAADVGAPHGRARVFVAAHPNGDAVWQQPVRLTRCGRASVPGLTGPDVAPDPDGFGHERLGVARGRRAGPTDSRVTAPDTTGDGRDEGRAEPARLIGRPDATQRGGSPAADTDEQGLQGHGRLHDPHRGGETAAHDRVAWGIYEPAIRRWETLTRPAPAPVQPSPRGGRPQLSPAFVEWLMGLPAGHVTDVGISRNAQLTALGNGVVPQQAAAAYTQLLDALVRAT